MKTIKFRGERVDNGEMVFGDLIHGVGWKKDLMFILPNVTNLASLCGCDPLDGFNVIPKTIGQFTGELDCNGVEVYEGDNIVVNNGIVGIVEFDRGCFSIRIINSGNSFMYDNNQIPALFEFEHIEVIGKIHD